MKMYILPIYKRRPNPALSRLLKKSVLRPADQDRRFPRPARIEADDANENRGPSILALATVGWRGRAGAHLRH